jgi:hypothetical protein
MISRKDQTSETLIEVAMSHLLVARLGQSALNGSKAAAWMHAGPTS